MFKTIIAVSMILTSLIVGANANAQTTEDGFFTNIYEENGCGVYVDRWDQSAVVDHHSANIDIYTTAGGHWLWKSSVRVTITFTEDWIGQPQIYTDVFSASDEPYGQAYYDNGEYYKAHLLYTAGSSVTFNLGQYYETLQPWDGTPGDHSAAEIYVFMVSVIPGATMTIDRVRVDSYGDIDECGVH